MLVATALVVLIMVMFAEVFATAVGTLTDQRGLAANDQKARTITDTLGGDLTQGSFRQPVGTGGSGVRTINGAMLTLSTGRGLLPLAKGDQVDQRQRGFLYISENDPLNDIDDVLHLTVDLTETLRDPTVSNPAQSPFIGRAVTVAGGSFNQPDADDGVPDGAGSSRAAEVCYFVRGGNLYRRVMLLRDPLRSAIPPYPDQPTAAGGAPLAAFNSPYTGSLYHDYDYSGARDRIADDGNGMFDPEPTDTYRFTFHGLGSLDNAQGLSNNPLALPWRRFGFCPLTTFANTALAGRPREFLFDGSLNNAGYIGRFLHEETSHPGFAWPGVEDGGNNVMRRTDLTLGLDGIVQGPGPTPLSGARAGGDLLVPNVDAFNIEVWDPGYVEPLAGWTAFDPANGDLNGNGLQERSGAWVDLGNATGLGFFSSGQRRNTAYGPVPNLTDNRVFDTWHTHAQFDWDLDGTLTPANIRPPFRPLLVAPEEITGVPNLAVVDFWTANTARVVNEVYFPDRFGVDGAPGQAGVDDDGDGTTDLVTVGPPPVVDLEEIGWPGSDDGSLAVGYRVIQVATGGNTTGAKQPDWPRVPGAIIDDGNVRWQCFDNRIGLERIRVTARYRDPSSGHTRQVTLIHSFVE